MPPTTVVFFQDDDGTAPVALWLAELRRVEPRAFAKCVVRRDNYRILYSFHGRVVAVLLHALVKEDVVPEADINLAVVRQKAFSRDPEGHTFRGPLP